MKSIVSVFLLPLVLMACGGKAGSGLGKDIDPRDTVNVPEDLTGQDSIEYIENAVMKSPFTASDLLSLAETHTVDEMLYHYNNQEEAKEDPEYAKQYAVTHRDSAAMRLANRFMRMGEMVTDHGNAGDQLQWAEAVGMALEAFRKEVPEAKEADVEEIMRVMEKFSAETQMEMNYQSYVYRTIEYYRTIEAYRQWLQAVPKELQTAARKEYEAWLELIEARFALWNDVSYNQEWYSMKPMEIHGYYGDMLKARQDELQQERDIVMKGKTYAQQGTTVTNKRWEGWIKEHSVPEDCDLLKELHPERIPSDSLVAARVGALKSAFAQWIAARQALAEKLPEQQGRSYDNLTADIHCKMIGGL